MDIAGSIALIAAPCAHRWQEYRKPRIEMPLKDINEELAKRGFTARLERSRSYFHFVDGEAANWVFSTVRVAKIGGWPDRSWKLRAAVRAHVTTPPPVGWQISIH